MKKNSVQFLRFVGHDNCSLLETSCDYHDVNKITLKPQTVLFYCVKSFPWKLVFFSLSFQQEVHLAFSVCNNRNFLFLCEAIPLHFFYNTSIQSNLESLQTSNFQFPTMFVTITNNKWTCLPLCFCSQNKFTLSMMNLTVVNRFGLYLQKESVKSFYGNEFFVCMCNALQINSFPYEIHVHYCSFSTVKSKNVSNTKQSNFW